MGKMTTFAVAAGVTVVLAASAVAVVVAPGMALSDSTPVVQETTAPKLTLPADGFTVLAPEEAPPFSDYTNSGPAGTYPVGTGFPQGFPYGVPVQENAHIRGAMWHFGDAEYQFMFAGDDVAFNTLLDQYAFAEWKLVSEEEVGGSRIVVMTNSVWEARLNTLAPDGRDAAYSVTLKRLSPSTDQG